MSAVAAPSCVPPAASAGASACAPLFVGSFVDSCVGLHAGSRVDWRARLRRGMAAPARTVRGLALVAVLWVVAALSLLAVGLAGTARQQVGAALVQRDAVAAQAVAEAAINTVLVSLRAERPAAEVSTHSVAYRGVQATVTVMPLAGLVALNAADADLLAALLQSAASLPAAQAQALAQDIVAWRDTPPAAGITQGARSAPRFEAVDDLMLVPGMDYGLYARIAPLLSADGRERTFNPQWAPPALRDALPAGAEAAQASTGFATNFYRLQADVPVDEGKMLRFTRDVQLQTDNARGMPWRILREGRRMLAAGAD